MRAACAPPRSARRCTSSTARAKALKTLSTPTAVGGIAFDAKGKRVAASHYNGASLWFVAAKEDKPRVLEWKGSHGAIAISPDGTHVVTAMQENALHGWRLEDNQHMRMSGYPSKTQVALLHRARPLAGDERRRCVVLWPFFGGGPMGKAPTELAGGDGILCTAVACHPQHEVVAAGFADGLVLLSEIASGKVVPVAAPGARRGLRAGLERHGLASRLRDGDRLRRPRRPLPPLRKRRHGHRHAAGALRAFPASASAPGR